YDPGVGGHGMGDWTRGRIYRVTPKGHQGYKVPPVKLDTPEGIRAALRSPARSVQYMALARLREMPPEGAHKVLLPAFRRDGDPILRARALWAKYTPPRLHDLGGKDEAYDAFTDRDERFRVMHLRLDYSSVRETDVSNFVEASQAQVFKDTPAVRR